MAFLFVESMRGFSRQSMRKRCLHGILIITAGGGGGCRREINAAPALSKPNVRGYGVFSCLAGERVQNIV